jgi:hypothetical protein
VKEKKAPASKKNKWFRFCFYRRWEENVKPIKHNMTHSTFRLQNYYTHSKMSNVLFMYPVHNLLKQSACQSEAKSQMNRVGQTAQISRLTVLVVLLM